MVENQDATPALPKQRRARRRAKVGRPKGSGRRGPGRPKGSGKRRGRPKGGAKKGLVGAIIAKEVKTLVRAERARLKAQVKALVAKEVKRALKAAFR